MQHFIVDGYNLIHAIPSLKKTLAHDGESAREQLIHLIAQLTHKRKFRCTVIFDGTTPTHHRSSVSAPVHIVFSYPRNADTKIKEMIEHSKNRSFLVIVSSDREILNFAQVCSCQTHTSKHFANLLSDDEHSAIEKSDAPLSSAQVNEWLKIFGEK